MDEIVEVDVVETFKEMTEVTGKDPTSMEDFDELSPAEYARFSQAKRFKFIDCVERETEGNLADLSAGKQINYLNTLKDIEDQSLQQAKFALELQKFELDKLKYELAMKKLEQENNHEIQNQEIAKLILKQAEMANRRNITYVMEQQMQAAQALPQATLIPGQLEQGDRVESFDDFSVRTGRGLAEQ